MAAAVVGRSPSPDHAPTYHVPTYHGPAYHGPAVGYRAPAVATASTTTAATPATPATTTADHPWVVVGLGYYAPYDYNYPTMNYVYTTPSVVEYPSYYYSPDRP